jgi:rod shape determining protein RodA
VYAWVGLVGLVAAILIDPDVHRRYWRQLYGVSIALLLLVMLPIGTEVRGSQRWIAFGPLSFQPSEFVKLLLVLAVGGFLADRFRRVGEPRTILIAIGLVAAPTFLVFLQPDLGTALVYGAALGAMLFVAGARWLHLAALGAAAAILFLGVVWILPGAGVDVLEPYQRDRLTAFLHPDRDPRGVAYQINQSRTAVGAGGVEGRGVEGATQTRLQYLPHHASDFAFASLAEQRGFVGAAILLLLYLLVVWRGLRIVTLASDAFSAIVAAGIVLSLLFQIFINVGMTMGIAPITGIPLPFVSIGGSSLITNLVAIGMLEAIHVRSRNGRRA